ncbi:MAG TPA: hypothetical protein VGH07_08870 [Chthoniobacterales bacterium]|jgi:integrase
MTKSEAERKKLEFILNLKVNSYEYKIPSSLTFAHAVEHYREVFAPRMLRPCTFSVADGHLKVHLEAGWNEIPVEHIDIDAVNEWIASGLRCAELFALRINDLDLKAGTIRVDESADQRTYILGPCKNVAAYRRVLLADAEGREVLSSMLKRFLKGPQT